MNKQLTRLLLLLGLLGPIASAHADVLCVSKSGKVRKNAVSYSSAFKVVKSVCPKDFVRLLDTSNFTGPQGPAGTPGSVGPQGASGARGISAFDLLPSGTTVRGVIGGGGRPNNLAFFTQSLPASTSVAIKTEDMVIAHSPRLLSYCESTYGSGGISSCLSGAELAKDETICQGTFDNPTAPPGKVCVYVDASNFAYQMEVQSVAADDNPIGGSPFGFALQWLTEGNAGTISKVKASWAYTAP